MARVHVNNYSSTINGGIDNIVTTIVVTSATGLPTLSGSDFYYLTLVSGATVEIVKVTARTTVTLTVVRAQEGTSAVSWSTLSIISLRATANSIDRKQDQTALSGDVIDFGDATSLQIPNSAAPSVTVDGQIAIDTTITDHKGLIKYYSTAEMVVPAMPIANLTAVDGHVLTYDAATDAFKLAAGGGGAISNVVEDVTPQLGGSLDVNGNSIVSVAAGNISITPDTTGDVILDGLKWPQADGTAGYVLKTNGTGQLSWVVNGAGSGLADVVDDITPQLGGDLDVNGKLITSTAAANINIQPGTTGAINLGGNSTQPVELRFLEDGDNGTNYVGFKAPATLSADKVWELPGADGTAGQLLKTNGSGVLSFVTAGSTLVYITSGTASASATLDFTGLSSDYAYYEFIFSNILPATDDQTLRMRTSTDNGSTYDAGASDYCSAHIGRTGATTIASSGANTTTLALTATSGGGLDVSNVTGEGVGGFVRLYDTSAANWGKVTASLTFVNGNGSPVVTQTSGHRRAAANIDAVRFYFASGNIASGTIYVYGVAKS